MATLDELVRYDGKHVVVTGCASGIGAQVARQLGELGARVTGLDRHLPAETDVAVNDFIEVELADPDSVDAAAACRRRSDRCAVQRRRRLLGHR